jgi:hypothetical protein
MDNCVGYCKSCAFWEPLATNIEGECLLQFEDDAPIYAAAAVYEVIPIYTSYDFGCVFYEKRDE